MGDSHNDLHEHMGLDIVEMVMALETEFQIRLPEQELGRIGTVGELYDCVVKQLGVGDAPPRGGPYEGPLWERYLDVVERDTGVDRPRLRPAATFTYDRWLY
jgi:hypothetical protein